MIFNYFINSDPVEHAMEYFMIKRYYQFCITLNILYCWVYLGHVFSGYPLRLPIDSNYHLVLDEMRFPGGVRKAKCGISPEERRMINVFRIDIHRADSVHHIILTLRSDRCFIARAKDPKLRLCVTAVVTNVIRVIGKIRRNPYRNFFFVGFFESVGGGKKKQKDTSYDKRYARIRFYGTQRRVRDIDRPRENIVA